MAAHHITVMRNLQPGGPYHLGGYCFGGIVAYEMARQLKAQGEQVGLLAMLEGYALKKTAARQKLWQPQTMLAFFRNFPLWLRDDLARRYDILQTSIRNETPVPWQHLLGNPEEARLGAHHLASGISEAQSRVLAAHRRAIRAYDFQEYPGRLTLFHVRAKPLFRAYDPELGWGLLATGGVEMKRIGGTHHNILFQPHVLTLATGLKDCLNRVQTVSHSVSR
jgi:thioesterase domain-containing protein